MEFMLVLVLAGAVAAIRFWRGRLRFKEVVFFGVTRGYAQLWHRWWSPDPDPLPARGPVLLISNHTCSADPTFLQTGCKRPLCWLSSREHYEQHPLVRKLLDTLHCVPVQRNGRDAMAARQALKRLREGRAVCLFPEGNLSGVARGRLRVGKAGAAWLALRSGAPVVPACILGGPQTDELLASWVLPSRRGVRVCFGKPVELEQYRGLPITRRLLEEVTALLMAKIQELASR